MRNTLQTVAIAWVLIGSHGCAEPPHKQESKLTLTIIELAEKSAAALAYDPATEKFEMAYRP